MCSNYTFHVVNTEAFVDENITVYLPNAYVANLVYVVWAASTPWLLKPHKSANHWTRNLESKVILLFRGHNLPFNLSTWRALWCVSMMTHSLELIYFSWVSIWSISTVDGWYPNIRSRQVKRCLLLSKNVVNILLTMNIKQFVLSMK